MPRRWEIVGVVIALISLLFGAIQVFSPPKAEPNLLRLRHVWSYDPLLCEGKSGQITVRINDIESEKIRLHYFWITNTGRTAIRAEDFDGPIRLSIEGDEKILAVLNAKSNTPGVSLSKGKVEITPRLINPGKNVDFFVATERVKPCEIAGESEPRWNWDAEIADTLINASAADDGGPKWLGPLDIMVYLTGINVWIALATSLAFFFLTVEIIRLEYRRLYRRWSVISVVFLISVANGENTASLIENGIAEIWGPALVFFCAHVIALLVYFAITGFRSVFRRSA